MQRTRYICEFNKREMYIFIDETGSDRCNSIRKSGYGIHGLTPVTQQLCVWCQKSGLCLSTHGIEDCYIVEGSVNSDIFLRFSEMSVANT